MSSQPGVLATVRTPGKPAFHDARDALWSRALLHPPIRGLGPGAPEKPLSPVITLAFTLEKHL